MSDDLYSKLRLELIIESPALRRAEDVLRGAGATGWTVLPAMAGQGRNNRWSRGTDISGASDLVVVICVGDEDVLTADVMAQLHKLLDRHIGVVTLGDVKVLRPDRF